MKTLRKVFADSTVNSGLWPTCSPDLNLCDFNLWQALKYSTYKWNPYTKNWKKICDIKFFYFPRRTSSHEGKFFTQAPETRTTIPVLTAIFVTFICYAFRL
jgi:hypothetical protein